MTVSYSIIREYVKNDFNNVFFSSKFVHDENCLVAVGERGKKHLIQTIFNDEHGYFYDLKDGYIFDISVQS